MYCNPVIAKI